ncbi:MAG: hypothetical protein JWM59_21 [Verrucomicrobiales bacterium]|nr:hypothetical protein [Verrucomicrobiales bacterium]
MRCIVFCVFVFILGVSGTMADGAEPQLVKDLNPTPVRDWSAAPDGLLAAGDNLFFTRYDLTHGTELWKCDASGKSQLVKDIWSGASSASGLIWRAAMGSILYIGVDDGVHGIELWRSDGTGEGTFILRDIMEGYDGSNPAYLTPVGSTLYFTATDALHGTELWKTDGTPEGTVMVKDIYPGPSRPADSYPLDSLTMLGGTLYFMVDVGKGRELWKSDGSEAGTVPVFTGFRPSSPLYPAFGIAAGNQIFFINEDAAHGAELWRTDGTSTGTRMVRDIRPGPASSGLKLLMAGADHLFFVAYTEADGMELWRSDGTAAGTYMVKDIVPGAYSPEWPWDIYGLVCRLGDKMCFSVKTPENGSELWVTDGTAPGTFLLRDIRPGAESSMPGGFKAVGDWMFFTADDGAHGSELWKTDGTTAGTALVLDLVPGIESGWPNQLTAFSQGVYFQSWGEIWKTDGTGAGTVRVAGAMEGTASSRPMHLKSAGGLLYFETTGFFGDSLSLWRSDGTASGTVKLPGSGIISGSAAFGNSLIYCQHSESAGHELWKSGGTAAGAALLKDISPGSDSSSPGNFIAAGSLLFFTAETAAAGRELWRTDGTAAGTRMVADLYPGNPGAPLESLTSFGGSVYFFTFFSAGLELWKSDGTAGGTMVVRTFTRHPFASRTKLAVSKNRLWFAFGTDSDAGVELWASDGTADGTAVQTVIESEGQRIRPLGIQGVGDLVFLTAEFFSTLTTGLWSTDGTSGGTHFLEHGIQEELVATEGNLIFFRSVSPNKGQLRPYQSSLWRTDGSPSGTKKLHEDTIGVFETRDSRWQAVGNMLYFARNDREHGDELWKSDGTVAGTVLAADLTGDSGGSVPDHLAVHGDHLYFSAATEACGIELWSLSTRVPEITVMENGQLVEPGAVSDFGELPADGGPVRRGWVIRNAGGADLNLGGMVLSGPQAGEFSVAVQPALSLAAGASTRFEIELAATSPGLKSALLSIPNNDSDAAQNPFTVSLKGVAPGAASAREAWRRQWFGTPANTGDASDTADPDQDGMINLMEWALLTNPTQAGSQPLEVQAGPDVLEFSYLRNSDAPGDGVGFAVEWTSDPAASLWSREGVSEEIISAEGGAQWVKAQIPRGAAQRLFVRLKITHTP